MGKFDLFLKFMPKKGKVLDLGCENWKDTIHFQEIGYDVLAVDRTDELVNNAKKNGVKKAIKMSHIEEIKYENEFDGIWAETSLINASANKLNELLKKCSKALKNNGVFYCSFLYGTYHDDKKEEFYRNQTEETILSYLKDTGLVFATVNMSEDIKKDHIDRYVNAVLVKTGA